MPYPKRLLRPEEEVVLDLKPHWWFFVKHIATGIGLLVLFILIMSWRPDGFLGTISWWGWAVIALVWAGWLVIKYVDWTFTHFVVTSERVIFRTGAISKHGVEIPHDRINNINFHQTIIERIIGAGDLEIESAGKDGQSTFDNVRHPDGVQQEIYAQMEGKERRRAGYAPAPVAAAEPSIPDQIARLAELRDQGIISPAEFDAKKNELLGRM